MAEKKQELTFKYIFTYDYNPTYVNGAHGGISPRGELVVNFYLERPPLPNSIGHEINPNGTIGREVSFDPEDLNQSLVRFVPTGVVFNSQTAKDFHNWLGEKIKELDSLEEAKAAFRASQQAGGEKDPRH